MLKYNIAYMSLRICFVLPSPRSILGPKYSQHSTVSRLSLCSSVSMTSSITSIQNRANIYSFVYFCFYIESGKTKRAESNSVNHFPDITVFY
jgi:hypothetical protein